MSENTMGDAIKFVGKVGVIGAVLGWAVWIGAAMVEDPCSRPWDKSCMQNAEAEEKAKSVFMEMDRLSRLSASICWREHAQVAEGRATMVVYDDKTGKCSLKR